MDKIIEALKEHKNNYVGVLGDSILDEYIYGELKQKETPVFSSGKKFVFMGGAGNVANNIKKMGLNAHYFSVLGNGRNSNTFKNIMANNEFMSSHVVNNDTREICHKSRLVSGDTVIVRVDNDYTEDISQGIVSQICRQINYAIRLIKVFIISDYNKGCVTEDMFEAIKDICSRNNVKLLVDSGRKHDFSGIFLFKPTKSAFEDIVNRKFNNLEDLTLAGTDFKKKNDIQNMLITAGEQGLVFLNENNEYQHMKPYCASVIDPCGSGDTMIAAIAACMASGIEVKPAVEFANCAAGVCCQHFGTYAVTAADIKKMLTNKGQ